MIALQGLITLTTAAVLVSSQMDTVFQWRYIDFTWPSDDAKRTAILSGAYNYTQIVPMDIDVSQDGRVFFSSVNYPGNPARLGTVSTRVEYSGPLIQPYPSWEWTDRSDCDSIIETWKMKIDECNRLWVIDTGRDDKLNKICPAKLLAFDLATDALITKVLVPDNIAVNSKTKKTLMTTLRVETSGSQCESTAVYINDAMGNALIIWDGTKLQRIEGPAFSPEPGLGDITIGSVTQNVTLGLAGMDISPSLFPCEPRYFYFRPLSSLNLYAIETQTLKSSHLNGPVKILSVNNILSSQSTVHAFSSEGTLFMTPTKETAITCWNRYKPLTKQNIGFVAQDKRRLRFAVGIKVIPKPIVPEEELWVMTNRFTEFLQHRLNYNEYNIFVLRARVSQLISGTKCELPQDVALKLKNLREAYATPFPKK